MKVSKLRFWKHADAGWFRDLDLTCFPKDEPFLNGPGYHWWIVEVGIKVVAYAGLYVDGDSVHLCRAGVLPDFRRNGYHKVLMEARLRWARRRKFKVARTYALNDNSRSIKNLVAAGFRKWNREGYITFRKELQDVR